MTEAPATGTALETKASQGIPVAVYDHTHRTYRILVERGKSLSNGGFGVSVRTGRKNRRTKSETHLFVEEALFLHEKGLLTVVDESDNGAHGQESKRTVLSTKDLMGRLELAGMSFPVYLVYAHMRNQTYRVVRHTAKRRSILEGLESEVTKKFCKNSDNDSVQDDDDNNDQDGDDTKAPEEETRPNPIPSGDDATEPTGSVADKVKAMKQTKWKRQRRNPIIAELATELQHDAFVSPCPSVWQSSNLPTNGTMTGTASSVSDIPVVAWDVYLPNSNFRKSNPGLPAMQVAVRPFASASPTFHEIKAALDYCNGIPLKIATVADGGTVVMFALTDYGVPTIDREAILRKREEKRKRKQAMQLERQQRRKKETEANNSKEPTAASTPAQAVVPPSSSSQPEMTATTEMGQDETMDDTKVDNQNENVQDGTGESTEAETKSSVVGRFV